MCAYWSELRQFQQHKRRRTAQVATEVAPKSPAHKIVLGLRQNGVACRPTLQNEGTDHHEDAQHRRPDTRSLTMYTTMMKTFAIGITVLSLAATSAFALQTGGVEIRGNVEQTATVGRDATVTADGVNAKAGQSLATVHGGSEIRGNVKQVVSVGGSATVLAKGQGAKACQSLGTIGDNPACK